MRTKYNVDKGVEGRTCNGITFDSAVEMRFYRDVVLPGIEAGDITHYELQKPYELQPKFKHNETTVRAIVYVADFYLEYSDGRKEVIDIKGFPDSIAKLKRKMFWYTYPDLTYRWLSYVKKYGGWVEYEERERLKKIDKTNKKNKENENG